jgi:ketosteroid isomerase-like protein
MSQEKVEIVRRSLEADDAEAGLAHTRPDLEWVVAKEHPNARTLHGHAEILRYFDEWEEMLEDVRFEPADFREAGDRVLAMGKVQGRGRGGGVPVEVPLTLVYFFLGDEVARVEEYLDPDEAREAAGLQGEDASNRIRS